MKIKIIFIIFSLILNQCNSTGEDKQAKVEIYTDSDFATYSVNLALSLVEMVPVLPSFAKKGIREINSILKNSKMKVSIEFTYKNAYGKKLSDVKEDGETGQIFTNMQEATVYFQKMLKVLNVKNQNEYILTSLDTNEKYFLFAVIKRNSNVLELHEKGRKKVMLTKEDSKFYEAKEFDLEGNRFDKIIDYAGVPREVAKTQKMQSVLLTIAANSVLTNKESKEYWEVEKKWKDGDVENIMKEQKINVLKKID